MSHALGNFTTKRKTNEGFPGEACILLHFLFILNVIYCINHIDLNKYYKNLIDAIYNLKGL